MNDQQPMDPHDDRLTDKVLVCLVIAAVIGLAVAAWIVTTP